jgi:hypothetical protein
LIAAILLIPLYVDIKYIYSEKSGVTKLYIRYLCFKINLIPRKKKKKSQQPEKKADFSAKQLKQYADSISLIWDDLCEVLSILLKKAICVKELGVYSKFGFDDPMITGIATGAANTFVYNMVSIIERGSNLQNWEVSLTPDFDTPQLSVRIQSIIKIKNVYIIVIVIKLIKLFFKVK